MIMGLDWQAVGAGYPESFHGDNELLIVCSGEPGEELPGWVNELESEKIDVLGQSIEYLNASCGLTRGRDKPYAILKWLAAGESHLERRLLVTQLVKKLKAQFESIGAIKICLPGSKISTAAITIAEDINTYFAEHLYDKSKLDKVAIGIESMEALQSSDPLQKERFEGNEGYRYWINQNPDERTSIAIGNDLKSFAEQHGCKFSELDEQACREEGLNLLVAVGAASQLSPSRLFLLSHNVAPGDRPLLLVGKGITFDTGGINVKPYESYVNCMRNDMGGAALMSHLFMALVKSGYSEPLALAIPACENLVAEKAMKPGAIYQSHRGHSVVVDHTDAEGRLILADAISYAEKRFQPRTIITAATLTTAALRQFTGYQTPVYFAGKALQDRLSQAAESFGEAYTFQGRFLPFKWANRGKFSKLTNMGRLPSQANIGGGSNIAAHFLSEFCDTPLIHFDIFASTWNWSNDYPGSSGGATGAVFNSLFHCLRQHSLAELFAD